MKAKCDFCRNEDDIQNMEVRHCHNYQGKPMADQYIHTRCKDAEYEQRNYMIDRFERNRRNG